MTQNRETDALQKKRDFISGWDKEQKESRAKRMIEVESSEFAGQGYLPESSHGKITTSERPAYLSLESSLSRTWNEARMSYVYGFFQAAVFQIGAVLELLIEQTLRADGKWSDYASKYSPKRRWLGTLIEYCEEQVIVSAETLNDLSAINELRIMAVHMETEKREAKTAPDEHPLVELEDVSVYGENEVRGRLMLPGQGMILDLSRQEKPAIKAELMYKPQAAQAFKILAKVFPVIRKLQG